MLSFPLNYYKTHLLTNQTHNLYLNKKKTSEYKTNIDPARLNRC